MKRKVLLLVLAIWFAACSSDNGGPGDGETAIGRLRAEGSYFVDSNNGVILLRGVNVAGDSKVPDFMPVDRGELLDPLEDWGVNVIRFLFTWEAFETERGQYNNEYLEYYARAVNWAQERNIHVIIDFHQDLFSRYLVKGCGEGFPRWAIPPDVEIDTPDNGPACKDWGTMGAFNSNMHRTWSAYYSNVNDVRDAYLHMVQRVASRFANHPAVLGYDMLNEPWGKEETELAELYVDVAAAIRAEDPSAILFVSPVAVTSTGIVGTKLPPMPFGNYAYAPHYYDPFMMSLGVWLGMSPKRPLQAMKSQADSWNVPVLLGEFGTNPNMTAQAAYLDALYNVFDELFISGTQWNFTPGWTPEDFDGWNDEDFSIVDNDEGAIRANYRIRPYPRRTSGIPIRFDVDRKGDSGAVSIKLQWDHDPGKGATILYAPRGYVFGGDPYVMDTQGDAMTCSYDSHERYVTCTSTSAGLKTLTIRSQDY